MTPARTTALIATIAVIVAAFTATSASAQAPPRHYSMSTLAIACAVARNAVATELCGLPATPLPFDHGAAATTRSSLFRKMVQQEVNRLERAMDIHGDAVICKCLAERRAACP